MFIGRTIMQPLLLIFVFTYVFPKIGEAIGAQARRAFSTLLVGGTIASAMIFQGVQAVALPLVQDFGYTREIEDRVLAPMPVWAVAAEKVAGGAIQALLASLVVFPLALFIPANKVHLSVHWFYLITLLPLAAVMSASFGLTIGTRVQPRQVPLIFSLLVIPMTFLGAVYYPWRTLTPLPWLKVGGAREPAHLHERRHARRAHPRRAAHADRRDLPRADRVHRAVPEARHRRLQEARPELTTTEPA